MKLVVISCFLVVIISGLLTKTIYCKIYNRISTTKQPLENPYKTLTLDFFAPDICFAACTHDVSCRSFLLDETRSQCLFYNATVFLLNLVSVSPGRVTILYTLNILYRDCVDWYYAGARESGVYTIVLPGGAKRVRCNMEVDGGGWLVFQYRFNGSVLFNRNWIAYMYINDQKQKNI